MHYFWKCNIDFGHDHLGKEVTPLNVEQIVNTDITFIKNGNTVISNGGSLIDRWQTHIDAVDMHTVGIGGDSLVRLNRSGKLTVSPLRVQPLALAQGIPDPAS